MNTKRLKMCCIAISVLAILTAGVTASGDPLSGVHSLNAGLVTHHATEEGRGVCGRGSVYLGNRARLIRFRVRCHSSQAGAGESFTLQRYSLKTPHRQLHLGAFSRTLRVYVAGERKGRGTCSLQARKVVLACNARGGKRFLAKGWLKAPRGGRCAFGYTITSVPRMHSCEEGCGGPLPVVGLFEGKPRGC